MNFFTFTKLGRTLLMLTAVTAVGLSGCGGDDNPNNNGGGAVPIDKWMKKNLDVPTDGSWCYGEGGEVYVDGVWKTLSSSEIQANCAKYGRLYTWEAAKSACQSIGKRLPTNAEWEALVKAAGGWETAGKKLKARSGWYNDGNGTDQYGFSALPGGNRTSDDHFGTAGNNGIWWTATENSDGNVYYRSMYYNYDIVYEDNYDKSYGFSARCIQD